MRINNTIRIYTLLAILGLLVLAGCGGAPEAASEAPASDAAVAAVLAKADGIDGATDQVVANCPGCALAMQGSAEHAMTVGEYELHFCSDDCKNTFAESPADSILALNIEE